MLLILLFFTLLTPPVHASPSCNDTRSIKEIVQDKVVSLSDDLMPWLFQDPVHTIRFHLARASRLYEEAIVFAQTNPGKAVRRAIGAQHHMTLIEKNIRQIQHPKDVPYQEILGASENVSAVQLTFLTGLPEACRAQVFQLGSFQLRTTTAVRKLYVESLLP